MSKAKSEPDSESHNVVVGPMARAVRVTVRRAYHRDHHDYATHSDGGHRDCNGSCGPPAGHHPIMPVRVDKSDLPQRCALRFLGHVEGSSKLGLPMRLGPGVNSVVSRLLVNRCLRVGVIDSVATAKFER
jgi:hypothetical protein